MAEEDFFANYPSRGGTVTAGTTTVEDVFGDEELPSVLIPAPPGPVGDEEEPLGVSDGGVIHMPPPEVDGVEANGGGPMADVPNGNLIDTDDSPAMAGEGYRERPPVRRGLFDDDEEGEGLGKDPTPVMGADRIGNEDDDDDNFEAPPRPATPDAIKQWRVDFARGIEEKQAYEKKVQQERREQATKILQNMNSKWKDRCKNNKQVNLEYEKKFLQEKDALQAKFSREGEKPNWSIIPELANMSAEFKKGQRDTSRMRSVIMKLKS
mmetsp:Transcript_14601/g.29772  ORF Transcript_14601/g.29772 Transcript_14601/m.29772 type:complete len:266 (-) Transcript_14601:221-1018(-)|eukprot:CAMPEP_0184684166 /NCGR_PEP_ID=MMETSP0312-20130426/14116_1 /TAXON_ID=31354 /ORGANISM="Compsopogon coeruleus, Strain SAG 36.94" /LENGTH=265 /DNA_ID=CAMNT_0027137079 /DNA_START=57 /DNA_END=854 /DNA_ORIENTATION=+